MNALFRNVLQMSITGSWVIVALVLLRPVLTRFPRRFAYILWAVAGFRLCCPISFETVFSLFRVPYVETGAVVTQYALPPVQAVVMGTNSSAALPVTIPSQSTADYMSVIPILWLAGIAAFTIYAFVCDLRLRSRLHAAIRTENGIFESECVTSPFIRGIFRPRIYLPLGLDKEERAQVLAHERYHLKRLDHLWKLLGYLILTVHWFNPLCHLAFWLFGWDMEMSCDEAVLRKTDRYAYSRALVSVAAQKRPSAPGPLHFGETAVKSRVENILRWKPVKGWAAAAAIMLCAVLILACGTDPAEKTGLEDGKYIISNGQTGEDYKIGGLIEIRDSKLYLPSETHDLTGKTWQKPPFDDAGWQQMLLRLEGAAPETLEGCEYMELFVLTEETKQLYLDTVYSHPLELPVTGTMGSAVRRIFLLRQGRTLFVCSYLEAENMNSFVSDRLAQPGGPLDPTVETFAYLDAQLAEVLSRNGGSVQEKADGDEELYWNILRHRHIMEYLCHVMMTEGLDGEKGELAGILFGDVLMRRFEEPLIPRGDLTAAEYYERYMAYALEHYSDEALYRAIDNASGPMLNYLKLYYGYGE